MLGQARVGAFRNKGSEIGLATVYRVLMQFTQAGGEKGAGGSLG